MTVSTVVRRPYEFFFFHFHPDASAHMGLALGFAFVERLLGAPERDIAVAEALSKIEYVKDFAVSQGNDSEMVEEFSAPFSDLVLRVAGSSGKPPLTHQELVDTFNDMYREF